MNKFILRSLVLVAAAASLFGAEAFAWNSNVRPCKLNEACIGLSYITYGECYSGAHIGKAKASSIKYTVSFNGHNITVVGLDSEHGEKKYGAVSEALDVPKLANAGANNFSLDFESNCNDSNGGGKATLDFFPRNEDSPVEICTNTFKHGNNKIACRHAITDLSEIDSDLAEEIALVRQDIEHYKYRNGQLRDTIPNLKKEISDLDVKLKSLNNALALLVGTDFENIDIDKFVAALGERTEIADLFKALRGSVDKLREKVDGLIESSSRALNTLVSDLRASFAQTNENLLQYNLNFDLNFNDIEIDPTTNFPNYSKKAESVIQELEKKLKDDQSSEFLATLHAWAEAQNAIQVSLKGKSTSAKEVHAFHHAQNTIYDFAKKHVDLYGFLKASKVGAHYKQIVTTTVKSFDAEQSQALKDEFNSWKEDLNPSQNEVLGKLDSFAIELKRYQSMAADDSKNTEAYQLAGAALSSGLDSLVAASRQAKANGNSEEFKAHQEDASALIQAAKHLLDFTLGFVPGVSTGKDLYEAFTGKSLVFQGQQLGAVERSISFVAVAASIVPGGSSGVKVGLRALQKLVTGAGKRIKGLVSEAIPGIIRTSERIVDSAGGAAKNRASFERYVADLRRWMQRPHVEDANLQKLMRQQYRENAKIGSGSTAAAIRYERATGELVGGKSHAQKGLNDLQALKKWLQNNPTASSGDRAAAENVIKDLEDALGDLIK
jgi:hypothetical protein